MLTPEFAASLPLQLQQQVVLQLLNHSIVLGRSQSAALQAAQVLQGYPDALFPGQVTCVRCVGSDPYDKEQLQHALPPTVQSIWA